jgi:hypothetical protein
MIRYYQQGGQDDDNSLSFDESDSIGFDDNNDDTPDYQGQYDDLSDKFNDLQSHYDELQKKFDSVYSKLNDDQEYESLMGSFDEDEAMGKGAPEGDDDGAPVNWISLNDEVNNYKAHHEEVKATADRKALAAPPISSNNSIGRQIGNIESGGSYTATNPHSSATGKYQFLWSQWGDSIKRVTGVKSQQEFLHNPQAQEKFYGFYQNSYLMPQVNKLKQQFHTNLNDTQLAKLVHFQGAGGAAKYLAGQLPDKTQSYNIPISQYIASKQKGGNVARTSRQQRIGLNNPNYDHMYFPNEGYNTFRGLDNGEPVHLKDQRGKYVTLVGPEDTATLLGNVFEHR